MKDKQIYYRKKGKSIIIEGKQDGKSIFIWTLPNPETLVNLLIEKASYFTQEKATKILENIRRLDTREPKLKLGRRIVRTTKINTTIFLDANSEAIDEKES